MTQPHSVRLLIALLFICHSLAAQQYHKHKKHPLEIIYGLGLSNYLGELGGNNGKGRHRSPVDLELGQTRAAASAGIRKFLSEHRAVRAGISVAQVSGSDKLTSEPYRRNRNLNFRSVIIEANVLYEFGFAQSQQGQRYLSKVKGMRNRYHYTYFFTGIGGFFFNPQGKYKNKWHNLQPLGTEGQGLNGQSKYSRVAICIPVGIGFRAKIKQRHLLGIEAAYRFAFTDYLDDVSTRYFSNKEILEERGMLAAHFADPSLNRTNRESTNTGEQRGNPSQNDGYFIVTITYTKQFYKRRNGRLFR